MFKFLFVSPLSFLGGEGKDAPKLSLCHILLICTKYEFFQNRCDLLPISFVLHTGGTKRDLIPRKQGDSR